MKYIIVLIIICGCKQHTPVAVVSNGDTTYVSVTDENLYISLNKKYDSLKSVCDTLKTQLFLNKFKIEKIRFYVNLCNKNKSKKDFFFGWISRAVTN